ncbi:MAG: hypothetical protein O7E50_07540 [Gemmatimonadetes bacterium]|nr:hypothetical protein [Gemmatimonadota bacterium]
MPDVRAFLNELAVALQKHAMYPSAHPALRTVTSDLAARLEQATAERPSLTVGATKDRLIVEGEELKPGRALLDSLAARLHNHQIAALHFTRGATADEFGLLLGELAVDVERRGTPIGLEPPDKLPMWAHIRIEPVEYEALRLGQREEEEAEKAPGPVEEAAAVLADVELSPELATLGAELREISRADPETSARLAGALRNMSPEDLRRLLDSEDAAFAAKLIRGSVSELSPKAVVELVEAASSDEARPIGPWLVRLLTKLAFYAETAQVTSRPGSDDALRDVVHELVGEWQLEDPRPAAYSGALGQMATKTVEAPADGERPFFSDRLVMMGLEMEMMGGMIALALRDLHGKNLDELLGLLEAASERSRVAEVMWREVASRETLEKVLEDEQPNFETADRLIARVGLGAAEPLLEALQRARGPAIRDQIVARLVGLGPVIAGAIVARLDSAEPEASRHLLATLNELGVCPKGFAITPFFADPNASVRTEAYRLAVHHGRDIEVAIEASLGESDPRLLAIGLTAAADACPPSAEPLLRRHLANQQLPIQLRVRAVRALSGCRTESALGALVRSATRRRWPLRRKIAPASPVVLEALACVRAGFLHLPRARDLLELAAESPDTTIRGAASSERAE